MQNAISSIPEVVTFYNLYEYCVCVCGGEGDIYMGRMHRGGGGGGQGLSRLCVQRVIWTPRTLFSDSLDTQMFMSGFADDDFS